MVRPFEAAEAQKAELVMPILAPETKTPVAPATQDDE
jgi:hypothetical protein